MNLIQKRKQEFTPSISNAQQFKTIALAEHLLLANGTSLDGISVCQELYD